MKRPTAATSDFANGIPKLLKALTRNYESNENATRNRALRNTPYGGTSENAMNYFHVPTAGIHR